MRFLRMKKLGLDIEPHRRRMNESQPPLDEKFKDPVGPGIRRRYARHRQRKLPQRLQQYQF